MPYPLLLALTLLLQLVQAAGVTDPAGKLTPAQSQITNHPITQSPNTQYASRITIDDSHAIYPLIWPHQEH